MAMRPPGTMAKRNERGSLWLRQGRGRVRQSVVHACRRCRRRCRAVLSSPDPHAANAGDYCSKTEIKQKSKSYTVNGITIFRSSWEPRVYEIVERSLCRAFVCRNYQGQGIYYLLAMMNARANQLTEMVPMERMVSELGRYINAKATH